MSVLRSVWSRLATRFRARFPEFAGKLPAYVTLTRADRPIGILLLLWPTISALWIAGEGSPDWSLVCIFVAGTALMRSAGCCINDYADANIDGKVGRTQNRPLATGLLSRKEALSCFAVLAALAFLLVLFTNKFTIVLSFGAVAVASLYPFMKRYTNLPQVVLGVAFSWGILMAFSAQTGSIPVPAYLLFVANILWTVAYDTEYAMVDRAEDLLIGVKSTAILFGDLDRFIIGVLQALFVLLLWQVGGHLDFSAVYQGLLAVIAGLLCYQQFLIRDQSREGSFAAFKNNQWVGGTFFLAVLIECEVVL